MHRVGINATFRRFKGEGRAGMGGCTGSGIVLSLAIQTEFSLPIVGSCRCRRGQCCSRTMNLIGLKPKPTLTPPPSRRAGEGGSSPRPFGVGVRGQSSWLPTLVKSGFMQRYVTIRLKHDPRRGLRIQSSRKARQYRGQLLRIDRLGDMHLKSVL